MSILHAQNNSLATFLSDLLLWLMNINFVRAGLSALTDRVIRSKISEIGSVHFPLLQVLSINGICSLSIVPCFFISSDLCVLFPHAIPSMLISQVVQVLHSRNPEILVLVTLMWMSLVT